MRRFLSAMNRPRFSWVNVIEAMVCLALGGFLDHYVARWLGVLR